MIRTCSSSKWGHHTLRNSVTGIRRSIILSPNSNPKHLPQPALSSSLPVRTSGRLRSNGSWSRDGLAGGAVRAYSLWPFGRSSAPSVPEPPPQVIEAVSPPASSPVVVELPPAATEEPLSAAVEATTSSASQELAALELEHGFLARYTSGAIEQALCALHDQLGLPWYLTIPAVIVGLRTVLVPINIWSMRIGATNMRIKPTIDEKIGAIKALQTRGEQHKALAAQQELRALMRAKGFRPLAPLGLPLVQGSLFVSFFWALREMGTHQLPSLTTEGALWFTDLTLAGPWYGLPLVASGLTLLSVETAAEMGGLKAGQSTKVMWFLRTVIIATLWLFHDLPSAVFLYWCTNNMFSLLWGTFVRLSPKSLKELLKIPDTAAIQQEVNERQKHGVIQQPSFMDGFKAVSSNDGGGGTGEGQHLGDPGAGRPKIQAPEPVVWKDRRAKKSAPKSTRSGGKK